MYKKIRRQKQIALFEQFFEAHWQHMYIKAFKFLKNKDQACAVIQSIFVELLTTGSFTEERDWESHLSELLKARVLEKMLQCLAKDQEQEGKQGLGQDLDHNSRYESALKVC